MCCATINIDSKLEWEIKCHQNYDLLVLEVLVHVSLLNEFEFLCFQPDVAILYKKYAGPEGEAQCSVVLKRH